VVCGGGVVGVGVVWDSISDNDNHYHLHGSAKYKQTTLRRLSGFFIIYLKKCKKTLDMVFNKKV
jgi:hypothetical protein